MGSAMYSPARGFAPLTTSACDESSFFFFLSTNISHRSGSWPVSSMQSCSLSFLWGSSTPKSQISSPSLLAMVIAQSQPVPRAAWLAHRTRTQLLRRLIATTIAVWHPSRTSTLLWCEWRDVWQSEDQHTTAPR